MCFSLLWIFQLLVWLVVIGALIAVVNVLLPLAAGWLGGISAAVMQVMKIIVAAIIIIAIIWFLYDLITCAGLGYLRRP